ncbi:TonB-dependent receptor [Bacteroides sp.]|uniref:TonB-dependent receptor n=1 Tax=Bacteroides sp. TaxID=29523 RepID=UPI002FC659FC
MKNQSFFNLNKIKGRTLLSFKSIFLLLLFLSMSNITLATNSYSKKKVFNIQAAEKTVRQIFDEIEKTSEFIIFYRDGAVDLNRKVSVNVIHQSVEKVLEQVFKNTENSYSIKDRQINIYKKEKDHLPADKNQQKSKIKVTGVVTDGKGESIIGANVSVKGSAGIGGITNIEGRYEIYVPSEESVLLISYLGYNTEEIKVKDRRNINVMLSEDSKTLDEVVVIGYGQQKKSGVVSSVNSVTAKEIKAPTRNLTNNLAGQLAGIIAIQRNGEPGNDNAEFWIRGTSSFAGGTSPLVLVDGAPRAMQDIEPDEIETFTVLKDAAATAVYGAEGANGVILITSKRGKTEKAKISFRGEVGMASPTRLPQMLGSVDHMTLFNEARVNDGLAPYYSEELIAKYAQGEDRDLYPDTNWFDMLKNQTYNQRYTLNVQGGSAKARYFVSGAYFHETGIFKNNNLEDYDTNIGVTRYNLRSNIDIDITSSTLLSVDLSGQYSQTNNPGKSSNEIFTKISLTPPHLTPMVYSDGTIASPSEPTGNILNPYNLLMNSGYTKSWKTSIQSTVKLQQKLDFVTKGLAWMGRISFDSYSLYDMTRLKTPTQYNATGRDENGKLIFNQVVKGNDSLGDPAENDSGDKKIYIETQLSYNRLFADKHQVSGMLLYMQKEQQYHNDALSYRKQSIVGRASYSYNERYFIEGSFGYTGSETFSKDHRFGLFPAVGVAYLLTNEPFMPSSFTNVVNKIKIRASIGRTGNDNTGGSRFLYREILKTNAGGYNIGIGTDGGLNGVGNGIIEDRFAAQNLGWEIENKRNLGLDIGLFNNKVDIQIDYFNNMRTDILLKRNTIPTLSGFRENPWQNYGKVSNQGMDGSLIVTEKLGDFRLTFRGNVTFARNKILEYDEVPQKYDWMNTTGTRLNSWNVYISDGLYTHDDFIITENQDGTKKYEVKPGVPNSTLGSIAPGDIKFVDQNNDGIIDSFDQIRDVGNPSVPELVYGFGLNVDYKGLYASIFFQGVGKTSTIMGIANGPGFHPFAWADRTSGTRIQAMDRWTEDNPSQNVMFPRLHSSSNFNNRASSTWWMRDASFLRLKNIELGYSFNKRTAQKMHMQAARVYLMGYNIAVWDKIKLWDPEMGNKNDGMSYPLPRTFSLGVEITF